MNMQRAFIAITLGVAVAYLSGCATVRSTTAWNPTNPSFGVVPVTKPCTVVTPEGEKVEESCTTLLQKDLLVLLVEYQRACVAAGGTKKGCEPHVRPAN